MFFSVFIFTVPLWAKGINMEIGLLLEHFNWKKFTPNGILEVEESGVRKGINITWWNKEVLPYYIFGDSAIYAGTVKYNNPLIDQDISYFCMRVETGIGFSKEVTIRYSSVKTIPYLSLVSHYWKKLYSEDKRELWTILLWKIGGRSEIELVSGQLAVNLWIGSDFISKKRLEFSGYETIELKPKGSFFYGTDLTLKFENNFFIRGYYKHYKWTKYYKHDEWNKSPEEENDLGIVVGLSF